MKIKITRITLIITSFGMVRVQRQICSLADQYINKGYKVLIISLTDDEICFPKNKEIQLEILHLNKSLLGFIKEYILTKNLIRRFYTDIVHSNMMHTNLFASVLHFAVKLPKLVCTAHSTNKGGKFKFLAYRLTDYIADLSINVSEEEICVFVQKSTCKLGRMIAIHNGIDINHYCFNPASGDSNRKQLGLNEHETLFLDVGLLEIEKYYPIFDLPP